METLFKIITLVCSLGSFICMLYLIDSHKTAHEKLDIVGDLLFKLDRMVHLYEHDRLTEQYRSKEEENDNG